MIGVSLFKRFTAGKNKRPHRKNHGRLSEGHNTISNTKCTVRESWTIWVEASTRLRPNPITAAVKGLAIECFHQSFY